MQKSRGIIWPIMIGLVILCLRSTSVTQELELVGRFNFSDSELARSIYVSGNYAYLARNGEGLYILDISEPTAPCSVAIYDTSGVTFHDVVVQDNIAYLAVCGIGIMILDVSDPNNPDLLGSSDISHDAHGIYVKGDLAYLAHCEYNLTIFNVADPRDPQLLYTQFVDYQFAWDITVHGSYAFEAIRLQGLKIFDVSDPTAPFITSFFEVPYCFSRFSISNNFAYISTLNHILHTIDISNVYNPSLITDFDLDGLWGSDIVAKNNKAYISGYGVLVLDVSNPANPAVLGELELDELCYPISVDSDLIFLASYNSFYVVRYSPTTGIESAVESPKVLNGISNTPNPFNSSTTISFSLTEPGMVHLRIYNIQGQQVALLASDFREAGEHSIAWDASDYPSGVYFARLEAGGVSKTAKMVLLK